MKDLTPVEMQRYSRHLILPDFQLQGQRKLKNSSVLVVGSGGLGSPLLLYLAAAGIGRIGIVDFDTIDASNLQRQVLFTDADVGLSKAHTAAQRLQALNPHVVVDIHDVKLGVENARDLVRSYDIVADGTDNFPTRYLVNDACVLEDKPNVYASIYQFEGQCSVFHAALPDGGRGPNYRDLFPSPPPPGLVPSCAEGGVLGVLPGILGSIQALEVIKYLTGVGQSLVGRLFLLDAASFVTRTVKIHKDPQNPLTGANPTQKDLIAYDVFCGLAPATTTAPTAREISPKELAAWRQDGKRHALIDVREPHEYALVNMDGLLLPLPTLETNISQIPREIPVVVHCKSGIRSAQAIQLLERKYGFENLFNLQGGILAWQAQIDSTLTRY